ncbi:MAG: hypothetical protein WC795_01440 [Candidatus Paceibacterota bacterium]|jgi:hypothetical protein
MVLKKNSHQKDRRRNEHLLQNTHPRHIADFKPKIRRRKVLKVINKNSDLYINNEKVSFYLPEKMVKNSEGKEQIIIEVLTGYELYEKVKTKRPLEDNVLDMLLKNPRLIPKKWKRDKDGNTYFIFFWGTIYKDSRNRSYVRCLYFDGKYWQTSIYWLGFCWNFLDPALVLDL